MKKLIWTLVILVVVGVFGGRAWYLHKQAVAEKDVVKIGAVLPMTGNVPDDGDMTNKVMREALEEFNKTSNVKVKLITEDGKFTAKDSISAFRKLQSQGVDVIFVYGDVPSIAISPISQEQNLPIYACACKTVKLGVNTFPDTRYLIDFISDYAINDLKVSNAAIFHVKGPEPELMADHFEKRLTEKNIPILKKQVYTDNSSGIRSLVNKVLQENPETIAVFGWGPTYPILLNKIREQGFTGTILTDWNVTSYRNEIKATQYPLYFTDTRFDIDSDNAEIRSFVNFFQKKYNKMPSSFAMINYISAGIIANAIKSTDYSVNDVYERILKTKDFPSILGPVSIGEDRHMRLPLVIKKLQPDGTLKIIKE